MQMQLASRSSTARVAAGARRAAPLAAPRPALAARRSVRARAWDDDEDELRPLNQWPEPEFTARVLEAFPDQGLANVEEARALYESGWTYLDVRSEFEIDESGKVKGSVNVPFVIIKRVFDPETRERVIKKDPNPDFIKTMEKKFPNKQAKLLVGCSNGRAYSVDVLEALDEAGYENLAWLKGGYNAWYNVFDNKLKRRVYGEYAEAYKHDGDSCGIHASGAGFARVDAIERIQLPVY
ncbi:hypothetical protein Rsub_10632 [Raphidocelis subcapitata]|uniref:Rhodanese domain-containing protein n=1 Tax=Raphidocelis subcapitata TaxID=307507 RepID=A0A2V0PEL9_9CHLO|nr:hypothetical protein Rsub_10632 [Raphidocelis subcapitata]|eukprot:GBF97959.1 hypothetical protein Rsub_10632 [Raphidocelis subcapitata]